MPHPRRLLACLTLLGLAAITAAIARPAAPQAPSLPGKLAQRVKFTGIKDPKTTLDEALDRLAKEFGLAFEVNEKAFEAENLKDVLKTEVASPNPIPPMKDVRLSAVLRTLLGRIPNVASGATWMVRDDHIEITTGQFQVEEVWGTYNGPRLPLVQVILDKVPLEAALRDLSEQAGFNVLLDGRAAEQGQTPVSARLLNTPLDTAARLLADMADLQAVHLDNVLYVTSRENAAALEARLEKERKAAGDEDAARFRKGFGPGAVRLGGPMG
jgi:hypothetical protein